MGWGGGGDGWNCEESVLAKDFHKFQNDINHTVL